MRCTDQENGVRLAASSSTERLVDSLHPFYNYTCTVAAVTVAEGPFSLSVTITTGQDGNNNILAVIPRLLLSKLYCYV